MKKGGFLRNVLDTIRSNPSGQQHGSGTGSSSSAGAPGCRGATDYGGLLKPQHFSLSHVARHGFPENPTALAFDPVQKIAAIGTKSGALRVFGRPGVDVWAQHKPEFAVTHIKFIVNQGAIITVTADESIHLWSLRGPNLKLQLSTNTNNAASSTPGQTSQSPTMTSSSSHATSGNLASQQSFVGTSQASTATLTSAQNTDSGAQPGDPDYLADQLSSSPTIDQSKQYSRQPEILHTLKFQREHITCLHQTLMSKWLYIGTERGNVHVANVETFELSGYSIAWNKAIELSRKTHPGAIIHISECPQDTNKLLIGYESGCIALWDLKSRNAEGRYYYTENLLWLAWHFEGKQFVAAHGDGSLVTWQTRSNARPVKVIQPHAKSAPQSTTEQLHHNDNSSSLLQQQQQPSLASSFARALNNELYRPINKVDWKTSKNNEQFLLFSGGLPYDGLEQDQQQQQQSRQLAAQSPLASSNQTINQQYLKSSTATPSSLTSPSPMSPSVSPSSQSVASRQSLNHPQQQHHFKEKKSLRSTSLTVMYGKSITVLEMDETIIDFIIVCDNSPYENDTADPYAALVLLANDLILIDLTSSGYPSFDSPYPASSLNESPVTCVQYLADCSSDLIPFLYSTSQNVVSRAPKKGFSDKEWPINGGEWGQSMQSYPELVLTGHADGTVKFWDMSGVNFDLISKIKTSKLFERPNKLPNSIVLPSDQQSAAKRQINLKPISPDHHLQNDTSTSVNNDPSSSLLENQAMENFFAIEKIEYYPNTRHLIVAGALSQIIQFKLNKKDNSSTTTNEMSVILVEPPPSAQCSLLLAPNGSASSSNELNQSKLQQAPTLPRQHLLLKAKSLQGAAGSSSGGSSSSSGSHRTRLSGFQPELICITPLLARSYLPDDPTINPAAPVTNITHLCQAPPKVTALAFLANHNILAYSHENGIVLVDIIQKCVIMNATLADLYGISGPNAASIMTNNRDITVQPYTTSSILPHHYHQTGSIGGAPGVDFEDFRIGHNNNNNSTLPNNTSSGGSKLSRSAFCDSGESHDNGDNGVSMAQVSLNKSAAINDSTALQSQPMNKSNEGGGNNPEATNTVAANTTTAAVAGCSSSSESFGKLAELQKDNVKNDNLEHEILKTESRNQQQQQQQKQNLENPEDLRPTERHFAKSPKNVATPEPALPPSTVARARLEQTKSMALPDSELDKHPIAPPRYKKRQSVPVNNELMLKRQRQQRLLQLQEQQQQQQQDLSVLKIHQHKNHYHDPEIRENNVEVLERMMIKVKLNERSLECGRIEDDDDDDADATTAAATATADVREIDRLSPELTGGRIEDMKLEQQRQQQPSATSSGTISSLFTKLMGKKPTDYYITFQTKSVALLDSSSICINCRHYYSQLSTHYIMFKFANSSSSSSSQQQPKQVQSRFTANSMFQRQLSTTALNLGNQSAANSASNAAAAAVRAGSASGSGKLFQRQLTTSQLFSGPSSSSSSPSATATATGGFQLEGSGSGSNKQRAAALLASARNPSSSVVADPNSNSSLIAAAAAATNRPSSAMANNSVGRRLNDSSTQPADEHQQQQKKPAKNKRIISRMLSISAIHTGGLGLGGGGSSSNAAAAADNHLSGSHQHLNIGDSGGGSFGFGTTATTAAEIGTGGLSSIMTTVGGDQMSDKIDSSFTRSRSSSASSGVQLDANGSQQPAVGESILCLCFLDWAQATSATGAGSMQLAGSTAAANHKSASIGASNDAQATQQQLVAAGNQVALWLGTSQGRVLLVGLDMPDNEDNRILQLQSVNAEPIPQAAIKLPGAILCLSSFTCEPNPNIAPSGGAHLTSQSSSLESDGPQSSTTASVATTPAPAAVNLLRGQDSSSDSRAAHFMAIVSEKQAKIYQLPGGSAAAAGQQQPASIKEGQSSSSPPYSSGKQSSSSDHFHHSHQHQHHKPTGGSSAAGQGNGGSNTNTTSLMDSPMAKFLINKANCVGKTQLSNSSQALHSQPVQMRQPDECCLATYLATGDLLIHSMPKLNLLMESEFVPASNQRIGQTMCFSRNGHALYQPSAKEIAKFTFNSHYKSLINEMTGCLYVVREMPEMPRANFFKSLFSVGASSVISKQSDRDELFGSEAGKASTRGVAKHIPSSGLDKLKGAVSGSLGHEMRMAREGLDERGEKLSEIEDRTLQMMNQSETYSQTAHQLAQKFKDKKWYQF